MDDETRGQQARYVPFWNSYEERGKNNCCCCCCGHFVNKRRRPGVGFLLPLQGNVTNSCRLQAVLLPAGNRPSSPLLLQLLHPLAMQAAHGERCGRWQCCVGLAACCTLDSGTLHLRFAWLASMYITRVDRSRQGMCSVSWSN